MTAVEDGEHGMGPGFRIVAALDGCKGGWFAVWGDGGQNWTFGVFPDFALLWRELNHTALVVIDIPFGLPSNGPRACDIEARRLLGRPRASSVFPAPSREAVSAASYEEASDANREILGKGITKQCWGICPKIREVDELLRADGKARAVVREGHPEVSFLTFAGRPMAHRKGRREGVEERLGVLRRRWPAVDALFEKAMQTCRRKDVGRDDILDAAALYLTAAAGSLGAIPAQRERDSEGLPMEMVLPG